MAAVDSKSWAIYHDEFKRILGPNPTLEVILKVDEYPFAHEAGVYFDETRELFVTSAQYKDASGKKKVQISKITLGDGSKAAVQEEIACDEIHMGNGGVNYEDGILFCSQGSLGEPSALIKMSAQHPYQTEAIVTNYLGRPFNSVNDVVIHSDGSLWFTDPTYGWEQGFKPRPRLPSCVYRFDPASKSIRALADGFGHPNGICFSPDEKTVYVTDTDQLHGGSVDHTRSASIYAFDLTYYHGEPFLANRRLFALADTGIPDGVKCDIKGNVYSGCGDGVNVWSPGGVLIGKILIPGGAANFCFGRDGEIFALNEHRIWRAKFDSDTKGALLGI